MSEEGRARLGIYAIALLAVGYRVISLDGFLHKADAVVIGMMAADIAALKAFPLVYYGQFYMGSIEAWITAPLFMVTGPTWWGIAFAPVLVSTMGVFSFAALGRAVGGRYAGIFAALLWAITPFAVTFYNITPRGCYPEVLAGGALLLWFATVRWQGRQFGYSQNFAIGFLSGLLLWTSLLSAPFLAIVGLAMLWADKLAIFSRKFFVFVAGFILGALPFLALLTRVSGDSTTKIGFDRMPERLNALWSTAKSLYLPYEAMNPGWWLTTLGWTTLALSLGSLVLIIGLTIASSRRSNSRWSASWPLIIFTLLFVGLYLVNDSSLRQQSRYLLPLFIPMIIAIATLAARLVEQGCIRKIVAVVLITIPLLSAWSINSFTLTEIAKNAKADRALIEDAATQFSSLGITSIVWIDYERVHQLNYEAMTRGLPLRAMGIEGARAAAITNAVERSADTAILLSGNNEKIRRQLESCCSSDYQMHEAIDRWVLHDMKPVNNRTVSIPPDQWLLSDEIKGIGDRHFATTFAGNSSFTIEFKEPTELTRIRAVIGGRQPERTIIMVSLDGDTWTEASPEVSPSLFVPIGPKVYTRAVLGYDREWQEWNFDTVVARFVRFDIKHPSEKLFDIHEIFLYRPAGQGALESDPEPSEIIAAANDAKVTTLAADRWQTAHLIDNPTRRFALITPTLRPVDPVSATSRLTDRAGLGALVASGDASELRTRMAGQGTIFTETSLGGLTLFTIVSTTHADQWWTGFTLIDW